MSPDPVADLVALLELEPLEVNLFRGVTGDETRTRVYGGQVAAQALMAAGRTVDPARRVHSLHGYFLRPGDPKIPIVYEVDRIRDGGSFTTRRVVAIQHGEAIFHLAASFQVVEGGLDHAATMPDVPAPDVLGPVDEESPSREIVGSEFLYFYDPEYPIELRLVEPPEDAEPDAHPPARDLWMRTRGALPDAPLLHACVLTYASDLGLVGTALLPHPGARREEMMTASLDHAVWLHRPFRADEWLLYHLRSPSAAMARGLGAGSLFRIDGTLVATVMQEGLIRSPRVVVP